MSRRCACGGGKALAGGTVHMIDCPHSGLPPARLTEIEAHLDTISEALRVNHGPKVNAALDALGDLRALVRDLERERDTLNDNLSRVQRHLREKSLRAGDLLCRAEAAERELADARAALDAAMQYVTPKDREWVESLARGVPASPEGGHDEQQAD